MMRIVQNISVLCWLLYYFHQRFNYIYSRALKPLELFRFITNNAVPLFRSMSEYASVACTTPTLRGPIKLESAQTTFANLLEPF
jgi:hypothetical protein